MLVNSKNIGKLKPGDGMSAEKSTIQERGQVLDKIQDEISQDCLKYGFYIGGYWQEPIADYQGDGVKREITLKDI